MQIIYNPPIAKLVTKRLSEVANGQAFKIGTNNGPYLKIKACSNLGVTDSEGKCPACLVLRLYDNYIDSFLHDLEVTEIFNVESAVLTSVYKK